MEIDPLKYQLQQHLKDGMCVVVGSGISCAEGLPAMGMLADILDAKLPSLLAGGDLHYWNDVREKVRAEGLEAALLACPPSRAVEDCISKICVEEIERRETDVIQRVLFEGRILPLTRLFSVLLKPNTGIPLVTTNYDRLIELAAEEAGLGADDMFFGRFAARLDEVESRFSFCRNTEKRGKQYILSYRKRVLIFKPHGSLGWYLRDGRPISFLGRLDAPRLIITPGLNKFRSGYNSPFDKHRERANAAIDGAQRLLILGYGFNDEHLETHLLRKLKEGIPALILTMKLSDKARSLSQSCPNIIALEKGDMPDSTIAYVNTKPHQFVKSSLWDLSGFLSEVCKK